MVAAAVACIAAMAVASAASCASRVACAGASTVVVGGTGGGTVGKADASVIPAQHFTLSVMFIPPGQGNAPHTHEVEEVFFILEGKMLVFIEDGAGNRAETVLGPWDCVSCPANVIHGFTNVGLEPAYLQVMLGKAKPELMTYTDGDLQSRRDEHLRAAGSRG